MLAGKGKLAAMQAMMEKGKGKKPMSKKGKGPMPHMKKREMGALSAFDKGSY